MGEGGFAFLQKSHGGCDSPPDCRQEPPFESAFQIPIPAKNTTRMDGVFCWKRTTIWIRFQRVCKVCAKLFQILHTPVLNNEHTSRLKCTHLSLDDYRHYRLPFYCICNVLVLIGIEVHKIFYILIWKLMLTIECNFVCRNNTNQIILA